MQKKINKSNCLIIIPAKNEEATIARIVEEARHYTQCDIVVVDDDSQDNTIRLARKAGATVLSLALPLGAWGATQTGLRYAKKNGYDSAVTIDGDGQHDPKTINKLLRQIQKHGSDVAIAAYTPRGSWQRKLAWCFFNHITGLKIEDLTSGFRAYNKKAITTLASSALTLLEYQDIGVLLMLQKKGLTISEIPTIMTPRTSGHSRIFNTWFSVAKYLCQSLLLSLSRRNHFFNIML